MIERLAIFGATGDLTARYLLPGLAALQAAGQLGGRFQLASAGREEWDTEDFRQWAAAQLDRHGGQVPAAARQAVVSAASYHQANVADIPSVADVIAGDGPVAAYLALPPAVFPSRSPLSTIPPSATKPSSRSPPSTTGRPAFATRPRTERLARR
jgi:glucose-6-phosphate 1-dehydrogenase